MSLEALIVTILLNAALWFGAGLIACRLMYGLWDRVFATAVLGWSLLIVVLEVFSQLGQMGLSAVAIVVTAFSVVAITVLVARPRSSDNRTNKPAAGSLCGTRGVEGGCWEGAIAWLPAAATVLLALGAGLYHLWRGLVLPVETVSDAPIYHLYFAVRWWQAGHIERVAAPFGELAATYFPSNGALWFCWLVMTSGCETLAKVGQWPFWLLGGTAVYALARRTGASRRTSIFPAALWATGSSILLQGAGLANVDLIAAAWYLIAVYFLTGMGEGRSAHALFFGLAAGAALGTHATALLFVPLLIAPALWLALCCGRRWTHVTLLTLGLVVPSGYWYARNWVVTGNPVYPVEVEIGGVAVFRGWYDAETMRRSGYHIPTRNLAALAERSALVVDERAPLLLHAWRDPRLEVAWGTAVLVAAHLSPWLIGVVWGLVGAVVTARTGSGVAVRLNLLLTLLGIVYVAVYWWLVPYQSQQRFLYAALAVTVVPFARVLERRYWLQAAAGAVVAAHLLLPIWPDHRERGFGRAPHPWESTGSAFYPTWGFAGNLFPAWQVLEEQSPPEGARVAYAGTNLPYYLFGQGLRNRVSYVNVNEHADSLPHDYHLARVARGDNSLAPDPWPQWYRDNADYAVWLANLRRSEIDLLFVARENQHGRPDAEQYPPFPVEYHWARSHPEHFEALPVDVAPGLDEPWAYVFRVRRSDP